MTCGSLRFLLIYLSAFFLSHAIPSGEARSSTEKRSVAFVLCKNSKEVRSIRVQADASERSCKTVYTKQGQDLVVGGGRALSSCRSVLASIRANLETANWNCRSVDSALTIMGDEIFKR